MSNQLVAFTPAADVILTEYVKNQLDAISKQFPDVLTEQANETDPRLALYAWYPDRFPCFIIFENGVRKASINAKLTDLEIIDWVNNNLG